MNAVTRTLLLIAAAVILPIAGAMGLYFFGKPGKTMNYGELLEVKPLPAATLATPDGKPFDFNRLQGKWLLVQIDGGDCTEECRNKLYAMRQARTAQGKSQERIERVWLLTDTASPPADVLREFQGTVMLKATGSPLLSALPAKESPRLHLYLVDPLGNLVLRYSAKPDISGMIQDLDRLLRASRIG